MSMLLVLTHWRSVRGSWLLMTLIALVILPWPGLVIDVETVPLTIAFSALALVLPPRLFSLRARDELLLRELGFGARFLTIWRLVFGATLLLATALLLFAEGMLLEELHARVDFLPLAAFGPDAAELRLGMAHGVSLLVLGSWIHSTLDRSRDRWATPGFTLFCVLGLVFGARSTLGVDAVREQVTPVRLGVALCLIAASTVALQSRTAAMPHGSEQRWRSPHESKPPLHELLLRTALFGLPHSLFVLHAVWSHPNLHVWSHLWPMAFMLLWSIELLHSLALGLPPPRDFEGWIAFLVGMRALVVGGAWLRRTGGSSLSSSRRSLFLRPAVAVQGYWLVPGALIFALVGLGLLPPEEPPMPQRDPAHFAALAERLESKRAWAELCPQSSSPTPSGTLMEKLRPLLLRAAKLAGAQGATSATPAGRRILDSSLAELRALRREALAIPLQSFAVELRALERFREHLLFARETFPSQWTGATLLLYPCLVRCAQALQPPADELLRRMLLEGDYCALVIAGLGGDRSFAAKLWRHWAAVRVRSGRWLDGSRLSDRRRLALWAAARTNPDRCLTRLSIHFRFRAFDPWLLRAWLIAGGDLEPISPDTPVAERLPVLAHCLWRWRDREDYLRWLARDRELYEDGIAWLLLE